MAIEVRSSAFVPGEQIPRQHTKDGDDQPPPLEWSGVPEGTKELALVMEDPDAPSGTFTHWIAARLPADTERLEDGLPAGAVEGTNDFGEVGYGGPRPPEGDPAHRYFFRVYALSDRVDLTAGASADDFHDAVQGKELARGELIGTYAR